MQCKNEVEKVHIEIIKYFDISRFKLHFNLMVNHF